jgi:twinkle protein
VALSTYLMTLDGVQRMTKIVGDTACPKCHEQGNDKTSNHLIMFEDGGAYCNRCGHTDNWKEKDLKPTERKAITDEELKEVLDEFNSCKIKAWPKRKLKKDTLTRYGCRVGVSPTDRTAIGSYLMPRHDNSGALLGYQVRLADEKRFWNQGRVKEATLFGAQLLPKGKYKKLYLCESPIDAMSVYQAIKEAWLSKGISAEPNVVALPHGTMCAVDVLSKCDAVDRAGEIIIIFDNDKAGDEATEKVASLYPNAKMVKLETKDPNEMLQANLSDSLSKLVQFNAMEFKLDGMADIWDMAEEICTTPEAGRSYPWKTMTGLTYGERTQQIVGYTAGVGMGKTALKYNLAVHNAVVHKSHSTIFDLESGVPNTGRLLASLVAGTPFHRPDDTVTPDTIKAALEPLKGYISLYKHKGSRDWEEIKKYIRYSVIVNKSKTVYLDPITALVAHLSSSEANDMLNTIFSDMSAMTQELDFTFAYFAHLNPPKTGPSHERGGKILESQMTGSRAMMKWSTHIWGLEGNKDPDLAEHERNVRKLVLLKDRDYGQVGTFFLFYDHETTRLNERFV